MTSEHHAAANVPGKRAPDGDFPTPPAGSDERNFEVAVLLSPQKWHPGKPIFRSDQVLRTLPVFRRQDARSRRKLRSGHFASDRARRDPNLGIIANAFVLTHFAARHDVEFVVSLCEPDRYRYRYAVFSKRRQADVPLLVNFSGNWAGHPFIL